MYLGKFKHMCLRRFKQMQQLNKKPLNTQRQKLLHNDPSMNQALASLWHLGSSLLRLLSFFHLFLLSQQLREVFCFLYVITGIACLGRHVITYLVL